MSNGLKFTPPGGSVNVTVSHLPEGLPNVPAASLEEETAAPDRYGSIRVDVKDSGVGLSGDQLQQLFLEGVQFDANRLQNGGGSGLGLAIAKGIIEQHNGTITVASDGAGTGTTFTVELPLYLVKSRKLETHSTFSVQTTSEHKEQPILHGERREARSHRVLVVDDSAPNRKMLVRLLERWGHSCIAAKNGQEAVSVIAADAAAAAEDKDHVPIDTVLMDYEMPVMNGPAAARQIRRMGFKATIFGVTGNLLKEDIKFFMSQGVDAVLPKPISMALLNEQWDRSC